MDFTEWYDGAFISVSREDAWTIWSEAQKQAHLEGAMAAKMMCLKAKALQRKELAVVLRSMADDLCEPFYEDRKKIR